MFPGGMEVGEEELEALRRVIESKNLFRYYGVGDGPDEVLSVRARVRGAHGLEARALRQRRLLRADLRAHRRRVGEGDEVIVPPTRGTKRRTR